METSSQEEGGGSRLQSKLKRKKTRKLAVIIKLQWVSEAHTTHADLGTSLIYPGQANSLMLYLTSDL